MKKTIFYLLLLIAAVWLGSRAEAAVLVGRIAHVEGALSRYMDADESWVDTYLHSPAGKEDLLATGPNSRAEITFPNKLLLRLDANTELEIVELDDDLGAFQLYSGLARLYNRSSTGILVLETARGKAGIQPGSVVDVLVEGNAVVVSAVQGAATFRYFIDNIERQEVISGTTRLEFRAQSIVAGTGPLGRDWDRWCAKREEIWNQHRLVRSEYLPESMQEYAHEMEPYGSWSRVYYRGYYYWAWKPHHVAVGWSPYTSGYWHEWHGTPVWIDHYPWGWATHHHGHWIQMHGSWMWAPYVHVSNVPGVTVAGFNITFGKTFRPYWHPGRVRWIARNNDSIGWFPLAPWETYYGYRRWGPGTVVVQSGSVFNLNINLSHHRHIDRAVIIAKRHLHTKGPVIVNNYNKVKIRNITRTQIVKDYKPVLTAERKKAGNSGGGRWVQAKAEGKRNAYAITKRTRTRAGERAKLAKPGKREERRAQTRKLMLKERVLKNSGPRSAKPTSVQERKQVSKRKGQNTGVKKIQNKGRLSAQSTGARDIKKPGNAGQGRRAAASVSKQGNRVSKITRNSAKAGKTRQNTREVGRSKMAVTKKAAATAKQEQVRKERRMTKRAARNKKGTERAQAQNRSKYTRNKTREENKVEQQSTKTAQISRQKQRSRGDYNGRQKHARELTAASRGNGRKR